MSPPPTRFTRSANACDACRQRKVKCSGNRPCTACVRRGLGCEFGFVGRRGYAEAYVQKLLDTIQDQEDQLTKNPRGNLPSREKQPSAHPTPPEDTEIVDASSPVTELASGPAFESRVRSIIREHAGSQGHSDSPSTLFTPLNASEGGTEAQCPDSTRLSDGTTSLVLPSKDESFRLFDMFVSWMGTHHHFLDPRSFIDAMDVFFENETTRASQMPTVWFSQYLLVMAMGMLIGCTTTGNSRSSSLANEYFSEAMRRLPPMHELDSRGIISVEILCLAGLYLQWCDRKNDAYLYIGSAVRLALSLGCALPFDEQQGLSSERHHRSRIWWTAYIHDRRLSAALGLPMGADERQIRADLPKAGPGFDNPTPMIIHVKIAQTIGDIMSSLYGNTSMPQANLVKRIQTTLKSLHETERSIPSQFAIDFDKPRLVVTRTNAALYLMLFQAVILCIRPMILQRVKDRIQSLKENRPAPSKTSAMARLCHSCRDAARKSIRILSALRQEQNTGKAMLGCFDLEAAFSASFILVMKGFLESDDFQKPPEGLGQAADVMDYLARAGNKAAQKRLDELKQFCYHVWSPDNMSEEWGWLKDSRALGSGSINASSNPGMDPGTVHSSSMDGNQISDSQGTPAETALAMEGQGSWHSVDGAYMNFDDVQMDLSLEMGDIYSCYNDPNLPLTGIDEVDWAEVGKMFLLNE